MTVNRISSDPDRIWVDEILRFTEPVGYGSTMLLLCYCDLVVDDVSLILKLSFAIIGFRLNYRFLSDSLIYWDMIDGFLQKNQVYGMAGTQDSYVAGSSGKDKGPTQEYILLPLQPHRTRILVEDVALAAHEKPSESSPKDNDVQDSEDVVDKEGQHPMTEDEQVLHDELEKMIAQEVVAKALDDVIRQAFEEEKRNIVS
ncbi:hypothetical protein Tco_0843533 [Tanacetum coccineum]|uniref:Uncharacterized protein n=1 Tax=Tanacetum coccineum TaxID=301880 RepID=A0ABQ5B376_9ASTR